MGVEFVYRGHVRELLERVVAGQDTRPGTDAEVGRAYKDASLVAPFHITGYRRMWLQAFPDHPLHDDQAEDQTHY